MNPDEVLRSGEKQLLVVPSVPVWRRGDELVFDQKFFEGMLSYAALWPGSLKCAISATDQPLPVFGTVARAPQDIPFACTVLHHDEHLSADHLKGVAVVLAAGDSFDQFHIGALCQAHGVKCVYIIEYIPETRYQIVALSTRNPVLRWRRYLYVWYGERKRRKAFRKADGLQSNGTPAYQEYSDFKNNLLYFDTRVGRNEIVDDATLAQRLSRLTECKPLRLAFSGRLERMKGVDHLVRLAKRMHDRHLPFHLSIFGSGSLEAELQEYVEQNELQTVVSLLGAVDFHRELLPYLKQNIDLFISLHRQSDPSCTYLETLSCGVPILGYNNKAFSGILRQADVGWGVSMDDLDAAVSAIIQLDRQRDTLAAKSQYSVRFARLHSFEDTNQRRIQQLVDLSNT